MPWMEGVGMAPVTVKKDELLRIVRRNREQHRGVFEKAVVVFRERAIAGLEELIETISAGKVPSRLAVPLPIPEEHSADYERAIRMLEMHTDETIELTEDAYRCLVDDDWGWKQAFSANTISYTVQEES